MAAIFKKELTQKQLELLFSSEDECYRFLAEVKWEKGFICRKCGNTNYCPGKTPYSRRCTKCKKEESAATDTIFHNCKFPVNKAFYIAYNVCKGKEDLSSYELARRLTLRQMTCWNFQTRIRNFLKQMDSLSEIEKSSIQKILS